MTSSEELRDALANASSLRQHLEEERRRIDYIKRIEELKAKKTQLQLDLIMLQREGERLTKQRDDLRKMLGK